jgi:hypothetical protein
MTTQDQESPDVRDASNEASGHVARAAVREADTEAATWADPLGPAYVQVRTTWSLFVNWLLVLVKTRITIDMRHHTVPWGLSSFVVAPGTHDVRVAHNWIWSGGGGRAAATVRVEAGQTVRLRYRPGLFVFLPGKLRVEETTYGHHQTEPVEFAEDPHTRGGWKVAALAATAACMVLGALVGRHIGQWVVSDSPPDGWTTIHAREMSIALPRRFTVTTDPDEYADFVAEVGAPEPDQAAAGIEQFPDFFALAAYERQPGNEAGASVVVLRFPADASVRASADAFGQNLEAGGDFEVTSDSRRAVGMDRYDAVRIDYEGSWPGQPTGRSVTYLVDGGTQLWLVEFTAPVEEYDSLSRTFDRSIATLTLPTSADENEEDGHGQR